ncbi:unnamed protein product [Ilex paraguariensis]|uniref:Uncharacterized protein n=1 Tax=Ilex paraguariensis TaxID=185542 RepID=A0ABC8TYY9_9AQUA
MPPFMAAVKASDTIETLCTGDKQEKPTFTSSFSRKAESNLSTLNPWSMWLWESVQPRLRSKHGGTEHGPFQQWSELASRSSAPKIQGGATQKDPPFLSPPPTFVHPTMLYQMTMVGGATLIEPTSTSPCACSSRSPSTVIVPVNFRR